MERKGLIVAYRKLAREGNTTEEQTPIHIKDIVQISLAANRHSDEFNELKRVMCDDVDVTACGYSTGHTRLGLY